MVPELGALTASHSYVAEYSLACCRRRGQVTERVTVRNAVLVIIFDALDASVDSSAKFHGHRTALVHIHSPRASASGVGVAGCPPQCHRSPFLQ